MHVLDELEQRGLIKQCSDLEALRSHLDSGPVSFYAGFDPTADSLHVGHLLPLMLMRHLQRAGHRPIVVVGGGTGMIGDPSGKTEARKMLDAATIQNNLHAQTEQINRIVHDATVVDNADWLLGLQLIPFLRDIGSCFSVNRMIKAEGYQQRMERGLSFIEFNYQILQAYDFLMLHERYGCTLQIGGDDQWGNILAGLDLIHRKTQDQAFALTIPLLTTATGQKMGKTHAGAVWLDKERVNPFTMYQFWYNCDDRDVTRFLRLYTFLPLDQIASWDSVQGEGLSAAKHILAFEVVKLLHGEAAATQAQAGAKGLVDQLPVHNVNVGTLVVDAMVAAGLTHNKSDGRRLIEQGGVRLNGVRISDVKRVFTEIDLDNDTILRVGKARTIRITKKG